MYILFVIIIHYQMSKADSIAASSISGFASEAECTQAGAKIKAGIAQEEISFSCVKQSK